jgi:hypothetical protein
MATVKRSSILELIECINASEGKFETSKDGMIRYLSVQLSVNADVFEDVGITAAKNTSFNISELLYFISMISETDAIFLFTVGTTERILNLLDVIARRSQGVIILN